MCKECLSPDADIADAGEYYGYPDCCIMAFMKDIIYMYAGMGFPHRNREDGSPWDGTGFIPCDVHAQKIKEAGNMDAMIEEIQLKYLLVLN